MYGADDGRCAVARNRLPELPPEKPVQDLHRYDPEREDRQKENVAD